MVLVVALLLGVSHPLWLKSHVSDAPNQPPAPPTLTVASYNLKWGNDDWQGIAQRIRETGADVVLLQESSEDAATNLSALLSAEYPHLEFRNRPSKLGLAILSRLPLTNIRTIMREDWDYHLTMLADVAWNTQTLTLVNLHLRHKEIIATDDIRARQIKRIWPLLPEDAPLIVAGDFNSYADETPPAFLRDKGLTDSHASGGAKDTWRWKKGPFGASMRIDYIFHSRHFAAKNCRVIEKGPSDHFPIVTVLTWSVPRSTPACY